MVSSKTTALIGSLAALLIVSPMVAQVLWRPAAVALGSPLDGLSLAVSASAVLVTALAGGLAARGLSRGEEGDPWPTKLPSQLLAPAAALVAGGALGGLGGALALLAVAITTQLALPPMFRSLHAHERQLDRPRPIALLLWCLLAAGCVVASVDLATYFGDPWAAGHGVTAQGGIYRHLCLSAYLHAAELARNGVDNVYDLSWVPPMGSQLPETAAHMAPFQLDRYGYPPQFLLLPRALIAIVPDFFAQRAFWCSANAVLLAAVLWRVGLWVGPRSGRVARWLAPALWLLGGVTFQSGNIQLAVLGLGMLAMIAFDERRERAGGAYLAVVTLAKIAPGVLGLLLLVQRRWRAVAWTAGIALLLTALALLVFGPGIFEAFVTYHLPRVSSGEAYDFLDDSPRQINENLSPFGIPFKLRLLGLSLDPWVWGPRVAGLYTVVVVLLAIVAGRRRVDRRGQAALWMLVLTIASLRSPMAPGYMLAGVFWAMTLVAPELQSARGWIMGLLLFALMMLSTPLLPLWTPMVLLGQAAMHGVIVWLMLRRWPALDPEHRPHVLGEEARAPGEGRAGAACARLLYRRRRG